MFKSFFLTKAEKTFLIFLVLTAVMCLLSCKDNIDKQPDKKEIKIIEISKDSVVTIDSSAHLDSVQADTVVVPPEQLTIVEQRVYVPPTDSLVDAIYMSQVGVREATGHNDGKDVEKYLRSVGLGKGNAWCAAFVKWCFDQAHVKTTITAWAPTAHNKNDVVFFNGQSLKDIRRGDVGTLYFASLRRIGHTFFIKGRFGVSSLQTVEGNTNQSGSREGDGVYVKIRPKSSVYSVTRWF